MRRSLAIVTAVTLPLLATASLAAGMTAAGAIKALDAKNHQITLVDGRTFAVPSTWNFAAYRVGEKVQVNYEMQDGKMNATSVAAAK